MSQADFLSSQQPLSPFRQRFFLAAVSDSGRSGLGKFSNGKQRPGPSSEVLRRKIISYYRLKYPSDIFRTNAVAGSVFADILEEFASGKIVAVAGMVRARRRSCNSDFMFDAAFPPEMKFD